MLEIQNSYQAGNTVYLECTFKDINGIKVNPDNVKVIFYDYRYTVIQEILLDDSNIIETGVYFFNYITPNDDEKRFIYEWQGIVNGFPSLKRGSFRTVFI
jgi:hypothetical protein